MPTVDLNYRPNPDRSVCVFGDIGDELVSRLAPEILRLRHASDAPITVYINSNGGSTRCLDYIHSLLASKGLSAKKGRVITVVVGNAKSAAANLLTLGDYAVAYPTASILFHGVRYGGVDVVTMETAESMANQLHSTNRATAAQLARVGAERLAFHYARLKGEFAEVRSSSPKENLSDIECFAHVLQRHLSPVGKQIVFKAMERWQSLKILSEQVMRKARQAQKSGLKFEAAVLHGVINYEVKRNANTDWSLGGKGNGLLRVVSDFTLQRDYDVGHHTRLVWNLFAKFSSAFFTEQDIATIKAVVANADKPSGVSDETLNYANSRIEEVIKPFCYFAASLWQGLQEEENPLRPSDAYWLGAIDEIYDTALPSLRDIAEGDDEDQETLPLDSKPLEPKAPSQ